MRLVKYFFYLTVLIFPLGQLMSLTVPAYPEVRIHLLDVLVGLTVGVWIAGRSLNVRRLYSTSDVVSRPFQKLEAKLFSYSKLSFLSQSLLVFIGVGVLSILVNIDNYKLQQLVVGSLYLVRFAVYGGLYFVVRDLQDSTSGDSLPQYQSRWTSGRYGASRETPDVLTPSFLLTAVGVSSAILGLFQFFLYPNLRNLQYLGWDPHLHRAFGTFLDPQFLGIILVLTLLLILAELKDLKLGDLLQDLKRGYLLRKEPRFFSALIVFIVLLLTYSRSSYLALAVGLGILALHHPRTTWGSGQCVGCGVRGLGKIRVIGVIVVIGVLLIFFRPKGIAGNLLRSETAISRIDSWRGAVAIWKEKPILGVGFNTLRYVRDSSPSQRSSTDQRFSSTSGDLLPQYQSRWTSGRYGASRKTPAVYSVSHSASGVDNSFLFVLATTGVVGLVAYLNLWRELVSKTNQTNRTDRTNRTNIAVAATLFTHALFNNTLFYPWVMWWLWVYFARFNVGRSTSRCTFGERDRP